MSNLTPPQSSDKKRTAAETPSVPMAPFSFSARVVEHVSARNTPTEREKIITVKEERSGRYMYIQGLPRDGNKSTKSKAKLSVYPITKCTKVAVPWDHIRHYGMLALHFERKKPESMDMARKRLGPGDTSPREKKTITIVRIRSWSLEDTSHIKKLWSLCKKAVSNNTSRIESNWGANPKTPQIIDVGTRKKQRGLCAPTQSPVKNRDEQNAQRRPTTKAKSGSGYSALRSSQDQTNDFASLLVGKPIRTSLGPSRTVLKNLPAPNIENANQLSNILKVRSNNNQSTEQKSRFQSMTNDKSISPIALSTSPTRPTNSVKRKISGCEADSDESKKTKTSRFSYASSERITQDLVNPPSCAYIESKRLVGIANRGNTCYLSAAIQLLMADSKLMSSFRNMVLAQERNNAMSELVRLADMRKGTGALDPSRLQTWIGNNFCEYRSTDQQDAHEFLMRFLQLLPRENAYQDFRQCPLHSDLSMVLERTFICGSCGDEYTKSESSTALTLSFPEMNKNCFGRLETTLPQLIDAFFDNVTVFKTCEKCKSEKAEMRTRIVMAPRVLLIQLNRFKTVYEFKLPKTKKISDRALIPSFLDLTALASSKAVSNKQVLARESVPLKSSVGTTISHRKNFGSTAFPKAGLMSNEDGVHGSRIGASLPSEEKPGGKEVVIGAKDANGLKDASGREKEAPKSHGLKNVESLTKSDVGMPRLLARFGNDLRGENDQPEVDAGLTQYQGLTDTNELDGQLLNRISQLQNASDIRKESGQFSYSLKAVIRHKGSQAGSGHYVADIRTDSGWYCCNDDNVKELDCRKAQNTEGYVCWYELV